MNALQFFTLQNLTYLTNNKSKHNSFYFNQKHSYNIDYTQSQYLEIVQYICISIQNLQNALQLQIHSFIPFLLLFLIDNLYTLYLQVTKKHNQVYSLIKLIKTYRNQIT